MIAFLAVLYPYHKFNHFKSAGWEDMWIATACDMVHDVYKWSYTSWHSHGHQGFKKRKERLIG